MRTVFSLALLLVACDGSTPPPADAGLDAGSDPSDAGAPRDWPYAEVPSVTTPEPGLRREVLYVDGVTAPPNPDTGDATPAEANRFPVVRFSAADTPDVRAVVVAMPGIFGGAGSFEMLARHLVRRSIDAGEPIEVWAIDRRSNLLEDLRGLDAAEAMREPDLARGYYFRSETVDGEAFGGFVDQEDVPYMSEWGLAVHLGDLRALIERVADPRARVFLMGHSLGGSLTEAFAAWRFEDGTRGAELLAGMVLVDGAAGVTPIEETDYADGAMGPFGPSPGVNAIRAGNRYLALPLLGLEVYPRAEIAAMDALYAPDEVTTDRGRAEVLGALMSLPTQRVPRMTNAAAFGWAFDDASNGLSFAAVSMGEAIGGPTESYDSLFGATLIRPSDGAATYDWVDAPDTDPPELTPIANLVASWIDGRTNFAEWYFPQRLALDLSAVAGLAVPEDGWQATAGLRAFDGALVDAPVLAIAAGLV
ncbi:MAG: hypothetical protein KC619_04025, partial [Myxococcales bacterium]|nr:hypothetical protein [Myxococcales bacterium]